MIGPAPGALVFVTVGTDHHRFDRLMDWIEEWLAAQEPGRVRCVIQHGTSRPPAGAECHALLPHPQVQALFAACDVVVCQGGPGSIMEAREAGRIPVVVPRVARLNEVVDDHQVAFARHLAKLGKIAMAETARDLYGLLDRALRDPAAYRVDLQEPAGAEAIEKAGKLIDELLRTSRPRRGFIRRPRSR
ncbi:hypothetical protein GCM10014719_68010 [Planomonospora parontospora subsp. antibiotica]|nr:hypothetical protein GCM10014719_68010 [Planomonospora parontospora subsp. antibiotica]GII15148.1 hypothetical protein Ppa05_18740 [Planomonospora parontospora subsp. antibiotica]